MRNKSILTKAMRRLMLMVLLVTQVVMGTSSAFADTVTGSVTFDSSVWGTTNKQFDKGSTQTWTNYLTLTLNPVTAGDNCRISGGYLGLYHQSTLEITAPVGCTITGMTIAGSNYGGTPSTTPGSLTSEPGSTSYTWTGSSSSVTISTDAGEHDSYDFQSIVVTYETSLDAMATTTSNGAIYSFNQNPNPFFGVSLYAKTITAGNQEMYFDAFGSDDPMIMQNLVDSSFYLHMPAQSRLRLQRSDSSSDIYITKAVFTFVSGSPSISPDGGTYNSSTHTWTGQESQIIFLFNEEADIQLIESEAGLVTASNHTVNITCGEYGTISGKVLGFTGTSTEDFQVASGAVMPVSVPDGYSVELTFVPAEGYYLSSVMRDDVEDIVSFVEDGKITLTSITSDMSLNTTFSRMEMFLQIDSHTDFGSVNWQVTDVLAGDVITNGMVKNAVDDIPVPYGSTVKLTFAYDQTQYGLSQLTRNGADILTEVSENSYTITNYATNDTIAVDFVQLVSEPYTVLANKTLTFYYDKNKTERNGMTVERFNSANMRPWHVSRDSITTVTFDASFADYRPTATAFWFNEFSALKTVNGLDNLNTSEVTYMDAMFGYCSNLKTIYINNNWDLSKVTSSTSMFNGCTSLVGGQWTNYMSSMTTATYARIDGGTAAPGYFTSWADTAAVAPVTASRNMYELMLTCPTSNVTIMYAVLPDSVPSTVGVAYSRYGEPITLDCDCKVLFYAERPSGIRSIESDYTFKMTDIQTVESPEFAWSADELTMTSGTEGATIYYTLTDAVTSSPTPTQYAAPVTVTSDVLIEAYAEKDGMARSMTTTLNYPYTAWKALVSAIADAQNVLGAAAGNDNVTAEQRDALMNFINTAQGMYEARVDSASAITQFTTDLTTMTETVRQAVEAVAEPYAVLSEGNTTLTFYYDSQKESRGGMSVGPFETWSESGWDNVRQSIKTVVFDSSFANCTSITSTAYWFYNCLSLTSIINIQNLKTDNVTDMRNMFWDCAALTSLDVSHFNTGNVTNMSNMFYLCEALTNIDVSNFNTDNVTDMHNMFYSCKVLTSLDLSGFNTLNVTNMSGMFGSCWALATLDVSGFKTDNVTDMSGMFTDCSHLTSLNVSGFKTDCVTSMGAMFEGCSRLTTIDVSGFKTDKVTSMFRMFYSCTEVTNLDVSGFKTDSVTRIAHMFRGCSALTSLDVSGFNTDNVTDMQYMFYGCIGLSTLDLSSFNTSKVQNMNQMFRACSGLTTIYVSGLWSTAVVTNGADMFRGCSALVGGAGTTFDADHTDYTYAHIDGGESSPGYFTAAGEEPFQESKNWSVVGTLAGSSESGVTMIAIDETNYTATFTLLPAGVYEYKVRDDNNIDRTYGQPDGSDVTVTVPEDNYNVTILFNAKTKAVSHELAEPIYSVIGFTSADGSGRSEFVMQRDSVGVPYTASTSVSMGTRTFKISINHEDSVYYGKKGQLKGEPIAFYTPMAGMNVTFYFDPVTKLATTSVGIIKDKYAVHVSVAGNGSVVATETDDTGTEQSSTIVNGTSEEDVEVTEDNTLTLTLQPADGNHLVSLIVDGVDVTSQIEDNKYMLPAIAETHTVSVTYVQNDLEPYAVLSEENTRLTFYYDKKKEQRGGMDIGEWDEAAKSTTMVVVDASFASYHPTSTVAWFAGLTKLASIEGMSNLKTDSVTNMWNMFGDCISLMSIDLSGLKTDKVENMGDMFGRCSGLTSLDVSNLNTENVNNMQGMFAGCKSLMTLDLSGFKTDNVSSMYSMFSECSSLKTIYVGDGWSTANNPSSEYMFAGCTSLVGGMGTVFDENHVDATYAHIDGGPSNPGYFTLPLSMGDANGDGSINIADAVATVTNILGQPTEENFYKYAADMNNDDEIDIFDVTLIVNAALNAGTPAPSITRGGLDSVPTEAVRLTADVENIYMDIDQAQQYTALQFDMNLPEGIDLLGVRLLGNTDHQLSFVKRGDSQYRVIALSMNNEVFRSANGHLIQLQVSNNIGENNVKMSDVLFVKPSGKTVTGISEHLNATMAADDSIYDLNGRYVGNDRRQLSKGIYIINHKKVNIK